MKLINISGTPLEYQEKGFIYEFPFPANEGTNVPDELGKRLMISGQYKEVGQVNNEPVVKKSYKQELIDLPKIGESIAKDIMVAYPTREELVKAAREKDNLPWDKDIDKILKEKFGGK